MDKKLVLFLNAIGISNKNILKVISRFKSFREFKKDSTYLKEIENFDMRTVNKIIKNLNFDIENYIDKINNLKVKLAFHGDKNYPANLCNIEDYPLLLYYKGTLNKNDMNGISIVGARKCTNYGAWACKKIVSELSHYGIPIISGMAAGIDKISHETSLEKNNRTVAVLGSGIDVIYPQTNRNLYHNIINNNGAVISEFPLGTKPYPYNFPYRNRIISGIGQGIVVIEAMEKSGTLITANYGAEQGKEVFAVPGNINSLYSKGTNLLIREGAKIAVSIEDILEDIKYENKTRKSNGGSLEGISKIIYEEICKAPKSSDELANNLNIKIEEVNVILTILELKGYIIEIKGGKFSQG